jgi:hypothetical protein
MASGKVFHSTGNGALSQIYFDSTSTIMGIFADNKDNIYIVSQGSRAMSFDDGQTWRVLNELINLMVVQPSGTIYRTEQYLEYWGLFRSHDTAQTWQQVARGVYPQSLIVGNDGTVFWGAGYFWFPGSPSPAIFIEGGLFSFPEDDTTTTSTGSNTAMISNLTPAPFDGVFLTSTYASSSPKPPPIVSEIDEYARNDGWSYWMGDSLTVIGGYNTTAVNASNHLYVANNNGFFKSTDFGLSYSKIQTQYNPTILHFAVDSYLYAAMGSQFLRSISMTLGVAERRQLPTNFSLNQNFPNPFNPSTTISYELPRSVNVSLSVFDPLGQEIIKLVNDKQGAGIHSVKFDGSRLPSGVYFYRLKAGDFIATKKFILLK